VWLIALDGESERPGNAAISGLYFGRAIALRQGLEPINKTVRLLRDLLHEPKIRRISPAAVDEDLLDLPAWRGERKSQASRAVFSG